MKSPLKSWSKNALIAEVERLNVLLSEHTTRDHDDAPDEGTAGEIAIQSPDPYARGANIADTRGAVLLDTTDVVLIDQSSSGRFPAIMLVLAGKVNLEPRRSKVAYLMPIDGAAAICSELFGLAGRAGADFATAFTADFQRRMRDLPQAVDDQVDTAPEAE